MSKITLNKAVEITPAIAAVTTNEITVLSVVENYGWGDPTQPGNQGMGRFGSVEADLLLNPDNGQQRRVTVWEGEEYFAVRGTWTDEDLSAKIATILGG